MRVAGAGMKPEDSAVEPLGLASRSSNRQSTPASRRFSAVTRPQAPAPTMATVTWGASAGGVPGWMAGAVNMGLTWTRV